MKVEKGYHRCGQPILIVKEMVGPVVKTCFVNANDPFVVDQNGQKSLKKVTECPECGGYLRLEKLGTADPKGGQEDAPEE